MRVIYTCARTNTLRPSTSNNTDQNRKKSVWSFGMWCHRTGNISFVCEAIIFHTYLPSKPNMFVHILTWPIVGQSKSEWGKLHSNASHFVLYSSVFAVCIREYASRINTFFSCAIEWLYFIDVLFAGTSELQDWLVQSVIVVGQQSID